LFLSRSLVGFFFIEPDSSLSERPRLPSSPDIPLRVRGGLIRRQARFLGKPVRASAPRTQAQFSEKGLKILKFLKKMRE
jgi:hypothetical protein